MKKRHGGITRTNWKHGMLHIPDTYATQRVGAILGSHMDSMDTSAGWNMMCNESHWAGFECSIQFINFQDNITAGEYSHRWYHFSYTMTASGNDAMAGVYIDCFDAGDKMTDQGIDAGGGGIVVFNWQAIVVSI